MAKKEVVEKLIKVTCVVPYFDKELNKSVSVGEVLEVDPARAKVLKSKYLVK